MITINGKTYDETKFGHELNNYITVRNEVQVARTRAALELEKNEILLQFYDKKIEKLLESKTPIEKPDGEDS